MDKTETRRLLRRFLAAATGAAACLALSACADRPTAVGFLPSTQQNLQSVAHWQVVADDVASAVSSYLEEQTGKKDPVMVYMTRDPDTLFARGFVNAMQTRLVAMGHPVAIDNRPDVISIGVDVMIVPHRSGQRTSHTLPGPMTAIGSGVGVAAWLLDSFPWGVTATALGLAGDGAMAKPPETDTEMVLNVSLARDGFYAFRSSAIYYVNARDLWHYQDFADGAGLRSLNDVPPTALAYDLAGRPYIVPRKR